MEPLARCSGPLRPDRGQARGERRRAEGHGPTSPRHLCPTQRLLHHQGHRFGRDQSGGSGGGENDLQTAELLAAPFTLVGLLTVFRGLRAAVLPLVVAIFAVLGSFMALTIAVQFTEISIFARTLVTALGLGLAIDYSLLMVARFREERGADRPVALAVSRTLQTA
ncbi:MAG: MMPL family transporter, partial [Actinomycetia bacterium]|nr:MMPL family transporter [Actinomycetes bacterium]